MVIKHLLSENQNQEKKYLPQGDSGGPLNHFQEEFGKYEQVGIASFVSDGGCENEYPHGFTRVSHYLEWIATKTGIDVE